jgi:hypothetical protein
MPRKGLKCATHELKNKGAFPLEHEAYEAHALFQGAIHFVQVSFGAASVNSTDYETAIAYVTLAAGPISEYATQYGPNSIAVDQKLYQFSMPESTYTDADLQAAVESISAQNGFPNTDCVAVLNPTNATNTDAPLSQGVLGYHGSTGKHTYTFVNVEGTGLTIADTADLYADALSHETAEMTVDPAADLSNPETDDPCSGNCGVDYRNCFDSNLNYLGQYPVSGYYFFTNGVCQPASVHDCPAPQSACVYAPPGTGPTPTPNPTPNPTGPCVAQFEQGVSEFEAGEYLKGLEDIIGGIICYVEKGVLSKEQVAKAVAKAL